jgi:hypothetical protein
VKILSAAAVLSTLLPQSAVTETAPPPIIDVHPHGLPADFFGPPRGAFCASSRAATRPARRRRPAGS